MNLYGTIENRKVLYDETGKLSVYDRDGEIREKEREREREREREKERERKGGRYHLNKKTLIRLTNWTDIDKAKFR
jgi:hypothetical protein